MEATEQNFTDLIDELTDWLLVEGIQNLHQVTYNTKMRVVQDLLKSRIFYRY